MHMENIEIVYPRYQTNEEDKLFGSFGKSEKAFVPKLKSYKRQLYQNQCVYTIFEEKESDRAEKENHEINKFQIKVILLRANFEYTRRYYN